MAITHFIQIALHVNKQKEPHNIDAGLRKVSLSLNCMQIFFYSLGDNETKTDYKFLALYDAATGLPGVVPMSENDVRTIGSWVVKWLGEFNVLGLSAAQHPLEVVTDKEKQVGNILMQANIGREVALKCASPQSHESVGAVESAMRRLKEGVSTLRTDLRSCGVSKQSLATAFAYVCMCSNLHSSLVMERKVPKRSLLVVLCLTPQQVF